MLYIRPDYYNEFTCTANECAATCCAGWQIVIDEDSLARYEAERSAYGITLRERIDWQEGVFKQDACKRCAFLNPDNLCDMYCNLGEDSLCVTCTNYPRHIEEFENIREVTLSISCPEVARIILSKQQPVRFTEEEVPEEEEEFEDFDLYLFFHLQDARELILRILQNRQLDIFVRLALVQQLAQEMQELIDRGDIPELAKLYEKYEAPVFWEQAVRSSVAQIAEYHGKPREGYLFSKSVLGRLYELEQLDHNWGNWMESCWQTLYGREADGYGAMHEAFAAWCEDVAAEGRYCLDIILEQLLVYFIFTYFCGAVYDDNVLGKVQMSLASVYVIYEMFVACWAQQGDLSRADMERIVYRYSRELEHSDENLERMEHM